MTEIIHTEYEHCMLALCDHLHNIIKENKGNEHLEYIAFAIDQHLINKVTIQPATLDDVRNTYAKTQDINNDKQYDIHLTTFRLMNQVHKHL